MVLHKYYLFDFSVDQHT